MACIHRRFSMVFLCLLLRLGESMLEPEVELELELELESESLLI